MAGNMSNPWTLDTIDLGMEVDLGCWVRRSSWRGRLGTIWFSGSLP